MESLSRVTVTAIDDLLTVFSPKGRQVSIRNRKSYGLSFCAEGRITYTLDGRQTVSDNRHAVLLPKGRSYSLQGDKTGTFPVINFDCASPLCDEIIALPLQSADGYIQAFETMKALSLFAENRAKIMSIFYDMLHRLARESEKWHPLMPAIRYLRRCYAQPEIKNATLAACCNMSEVYFRRLFVATYKTTPRQYLIDIRLHKAKALLSEGTKKIGAVAESCGFSSPYHFCRIFKEKTGLTPTAYRQQNRIFTI